MAIKMFVEPEGVYAYDISIHNYVFQKLLKDISNSKECYFGILLKFLKMVVQNSSGRYDEFEKEIVDGTLSFPEEPTIDIDKTISVVNGEEKVDIYIEGALKNTEQQFKIEIYIVNGALGYHKESDDKIVSCVDSMINADASTVRYLVYLNPSPNDRLLDKPEGFVAIKFDDILEELMNYVSTDSKCIDFYEDYYNNNECNFSRKVVFKGREIKGGLKNNDSELNRLFKNGKYCEARQLIEKGSNIWSCFNIVVRNKEELKMILENQAARESLEIKLNDDKRLKIDISNEMKDMSSLFMGINGSEIVDLSDWDVSNVENMCMMFYNTNIRFIGLKEWDVRKVRNMKWMMLDTEENRDIVSCWEKKGYLNECIEDVFYKSKK